ncbi:MAG: competence protein ComFB, partial [Crocosphaera sp.]
ALAAIERDPLRKSTPLMSEDYAQYQLAEISLKKLEKLLKKYGLISNYQRLYWNNLNTVMKPLIAKARKQKDNPEDFKNQAFTYVSNDMNSGFLDIPK